MPSEPAPRWGHYPAQAAAPARAAPARMGKTSGDTAAAELRRVQGQRENFEIFGARGKTTRAREKKTQLQLTAHRQSRRGTNSGGFGCKFACSVIALAVFIVAMLFCYYELVQMVQDERGALEAEAEAEAAGEAAAVAVEDAVAPPVAAENASPAQ